MRRAPVLIAIFLASTQSLAAPIPDPLSLPAALAYGEDMQHYSLLHAQADVVSAESALHRAASANGLRAQLELEAAYVEPSPIAPDQSNNDSYATLRIIQPVYDFSGGFQREEAAELSHMALQQRMQSLIGQRQVDIARQFFNVILADLRYARDNEDMAIAYVRFDADKDRFALAQISEVEYMASQDRYLQSLHRRNMSESQQRHSRAILAEALNRPGELPSRLARPELVFPQQTMPEFSELFKRLESSSPRLILLRQQLQASQIRLEAESRAFLPRLDAELSVSEYARLSGSSDEWRAQLNMTIPLYENQTMKSQHAAARAEMLSIKASLQQAEAQIRQQALQLWQSIQLLQQRRQHLRERLSLRELELDKNRALYEMEVKTDLGNAMVAISDIHFQQARNDFDLMLAWMQLRLLLGETELLKAEL